MISIADRSPQPAGHAADADNSKKNMRALWRPDAAIPAHTLSQVEKTAKGGMPMNNAHGSSTIRPVVAVGGTQRANPIRIAIATALAVAAAAAAGTALAQAPAAEGQGANPTLDEVTVTGSRIRRTTDFDTAS